MILDETEVQELITAIKGSRKYRNSGLNEETIRDLIQQETSTHASIKTLRKTVRRKLHNIIAPYLGEPDYQALSSELNEINQASLASLAIRDFCLKVLREHASTAERIPYLEAFYQEIFQITGVPETILDLACGLNPFAFPWMNLPTSTCFYAYDILQPRVDFINRFFKKIGLVPLAQNQDILTHPPRISADLCFFFKEAHRFEKRAPGSNTSFWASLNTKWLAVSLPVENLGGTHSLVNQHRELVYDRLPENKEVIRELIFIDEIVFLIKKRKGISHG